MSCKGPKSCPLYSPPACVNGTIVSQGTDSNGCNLPSKCVRSNTVSCPVFDAPICVGGKLLPQGYDGNGCSLAPQCVKNGVTSCPLYNVPACSGTLVSQGTDSNGCAFVPKCITTVTSCPLYNSTACPNGSLIPQGKDSYGCDLPARCVANPNVIMSVTIAPTPGSNMGIMPRMYNYTAQYPTGLSMSQNSTFSDSSNYVINFGDGGAASLTFSSVACAIEGTGGCQAFFTTPSHTISVSGTYTATVMRNGVQVGTQTYTIY